jgi:hypothetical protein
MNVSPEALDTWQRALHKARLRSPASFDQWFSSVQFDGLSDDGVLGLTARDEFVRDWVKTHFLPAMIGDLEIAGPRSATDHFAVESVLSSDGSLAHGGSLGGGASTPGIRVDWRISSQLSDPIGTLPVAGGAANGNDVAATRSGTGSDYPGARTIPPPARTSSPPPSGPRVVAANGVSAGF